MSVGNRPISQKEDEGGEEEGERRRREEKEEEEEGGRLARGLRWMDGQTKFLYESREKTFLRSVLIK